MTRVRKAITFSNVIACVALFVALGGSVYAAGKISGKQIKANSIPGNRLKAKTLTGKQVKPRSLTGRQIRTGSLTGTQIKAGSLTGTQINEATLTEVTASRLSSLTYVSVTAALGSGSPTGTSATAGCPPGTNVIGGGATVSDDETGFVNDSGPEGSRTGWSATAYGPSTTSLTVTAICTAAAAVSG